MFSEQKEEMAEGKRLGGGKGGVAVIRPHVGNLSHINLTPNFHTCSSPCESSNSLTHAPPHTNTHSYTAGWDLAVGFPSAGGDRGHHRDQQSHRAYLAYLHPM